MKKLIVPAVFSAFMAGAGFGCSSEADPGQGLAGGATGKGGSVGVGGGGGNSATGSGATAATGATGAVVGVGGGINPSMGGSSGSAGSSGTLGMGGACTGTTATGQKGAGAVVMFLIDTSLSMADPPGGTMGGRGMGGGGMTKMQSTQQALNMAFPTLDSSLNVGLIFYPQKVAGATPMMDMSDATTFCIDKTVDVPIAPLDMTQLNTLTTQVTGAVPDGSTPTHDAFAFAAETLRTTTAAGDKYIVLITDGEPSYNLNCVGTGLPGQMLDNKPLIDAVGTAFTTDGIKTFVVGSPGSENARTSLSAMARVGGTGTPGCMDTGMPYCHFDMTQAGANFATALSTALGQITAQIPVDCAFDLPRPPSGMQLDLSLVNVTVTNDDMSKTQIARDPAGDCATDGWTYVGDPPTGVQLCGNLCESVKAQGMPSIDVEFGCAQRVNPPR